MNDFDQPSRIHLIAIGGSVMHNLALALHHNGHRVSGSDDEIYNPARDRLAAAGLLPEKTGWDPNRISSKPDAIILGMHARPDNPELKKARELGIPVFSFPEFIFEHSKNKTRVVVAGSHGKTTTTAMIMHALRFNNIRFDYLVGAQLDGFERMVQLSDAPLIVIEGDEYLSSPIDRRPKFVHYHPHIAVLTGIAWDHMNVFPTFENYVRQFDLLLESMESGGTLFFYRHDRHIRQLLKKAEADIHCTPYDTFPTFIKADMTWIKRWGDTDVPLRIFGDHNLQNLCAARHVCLSLGVDDDYFFQAVESFDGAAKRLQLLAQSDHSAVWLDFAHAPSKVQATIGAVKNQYPERRLVACLELHTFSSLNKAFLPQYDGTLNAADIAFVYFSEHTLKMKKLPPISSEDIRRFFGYSQLEVFTDHTDLETLLLIQNWENSNLLFMSSGRFDGMDLRGVAKKVAFG